MDASDRTNVVAASRDFDTLFAEEHERLYRGLLFITGSRSDAEELMLERVVSSLRFTSA